MKCSKVNAQYVPQLEYQLEYMNVVHLLYNHARVMRLSANGQCIQHMAAVTLELKKRAKQTKSVYIARTAVT